MGPQESTEIIGSRSKSHCGLNFQPEYSSIHIQVELV